MRAIIEQYGIKHPDGVGVTAVRGLGGMKLEKNGKSLDHVLDAASATPEAKRVGFGFAINWMNMRDAATGKILWEQAKGWGDMYDREILARVPRRLLDCRAVSREVNFSSEFKMKDFRLEQRVLLHDRPFERWTFRFGFVMPGSTNTWQQVIEAADEMLPVEVLDGNVVIETSFFDGQQLISQCRVRIFYDA